MVFLLHVQGKILWIAAAGMMVPRMLLKEWQWQVEPPRRVRETCDE